MKNIYATIFNLFIHNFIYQEFTQNTSFRSSHRRCSVRKGVFRNFAKFTGKHLCQSLFFNKVAGLACNFIKKETLAQVFSCEFCEISKNTFFTEHLRWLLVFFFFYNIFFIFTTFFLQKVKSFYLSFACCIIT